MTSTSNSRERVGLTDASHVRKTLQNSDILLLILFSLLNNLSNSLPLQFYNKLLNEQSFNETISLNSNSCQADLSSLIKTFQDVNPEKRSNQQEVSNYCADLKNKTDSSQVELILGQFNCVFEIESADHLKISLLRVYDALYKVNGTIFWIAAFALSLYKTRKITKFFSLLFLVLKIYFNFQFESKTLVGSLFLSGWIIVYSFETSLWCCFGAKNPERPNAFLNINIGHILIMDLVLFPLKIFIYLLDFYPEFGRISLIFLIISIFITGGYGYLTSLHYKKKRKESGVRAAHTASSIGIKEWISGSLSIMFDIIDYVKDLILLFYFYELMMNFQEETDIDTDISLSARELRRSNHFTVVFYFLMTSAILLVSGFIIGLESMADIYQAKLEDDTDIKNRDIKGNIVQQLEKFYFFRVFTCLGFGPVMTGIRMRLASYRNAAEFTAKKAEYYKLKLKLACLETLPQMAFKRFFEGFLFLENSLCGIHIY